MENRAGSSFASHVVMKLAAAVVTAVVFLAPAAAKAAPNNPEEDHPASGGNGPMGSLPLNAGVAARTDVPVFIGAELMLEHKPTRLRLTGAVGVLPSMYARVINNVATSAGAYDSRVGNAIDDTMSSGLAWNVHLGWRPFESHGFLMELGYASASLSANGNAASLAGVAAASGIDTNFKFDSHLQFVDVRLGWEWVVQDHLLIQVSGGLSKVVGASSSLDSALASNIGTTTSQIDSGFEKYGYIPTASIAVGYRF